MMSYSFTWRLMIGPDSKTLKIYLEFHTHSTISVACWFDKYNLLDNIKLTITLTLDHLKEVPTNCLMPLMCLGHSGIALSNGSYQQLAF